MDSGWIKLFRKLLDWEWFNDSKTLHVFIYLMLRANHKDKKWRGIEVKRGQLITGRQAISDATGISQQSVRTAISNLISTSEITSKPTNRFSLVTICKFDTFQVQKDDDNQQINQQTNQQSTSNQPAINHKQELKNEKNEKKEPSTKEEKKTVKRFAPPSLEDVTSYCQERNNQVDPASWIDHYTANGWKVGKNSMKDWKAAVRTWEKGIFANGGKSQATTTSSSYPVFNPADFGETS